MAKIQVGGRSAECDRFKQHLAEAGIPADVHYPVPDYAQTAYRHLFADTRLPVAEKASTEVLTLPCFPEMTDAEVDAIIARVNAW